MGPLTQGLLPFLTWAWMESLLYQYHLVPWLSSPSCAGQSLDLMLSPPPQPWSVSSLTTLIWWSYFSTSSPTTLHSRSVHWHHHSRDWHRLQPGLHSGSFEGALNLDINFTFPIPAALLSLAREPRQYQLVKLNIICIWQTSQTFLWFTNIFLMIYDEEF